MRLFEIAHQFQNLLENLYDPETGVVDEFVLKNLNDLQVTLEEKCIAVATHIENLEAERKAIEDAKKKLSTRENRFKKQVSDMKFYLQDNMEKSQITKIKSPYFDITLCKNPPSVSITDENEISNYYDKIEITKDIQKIRQDLLNGVIVNGAVLTQKNSVRIR